MFKKKLNVKIAKKRL